MRDSLKPTLENTSNYYITKPKIKKENLEDDLNKSDILMLTKLIQKIRLAWDSLDEESLELLVRIMQSLKTNIQKYNDKKLKLTKTNYMFQNGYRKNPKEKVVNRGI